jgi:hypothetical protein
MDNVSFAKIMRSLRKMVNNVFPKIAQREKSYSKMDLVVHVLISKYQLMEARMNVKFQFVN